MGVVAYRLQLSLASRVHRVFHISQLKPLKGEYVAEKLLPNRICWLRSRCSSRKPFFGRRMLQWDSESVAQVLVQWAYRSDDEATWLDEDVVRGQFPNFSLEDKAISNKEGVVSKPCFRVYTWCAKKPEGT